MADDDGSGWVNLGEKPLVSAPRLQLNQADVSLPDGRRIDHYVLRVPPVVATAMLGEAGRVLLVWRYRFIPGSWGWELPAGVADPAEDLPAAAAREALNETGWEAAGLRPLLRLESASGLSDSVSHIFWTDRFGYRGEPVSGWESERIEWIALDQVPALIADGRIRAATTATTLLWLLHRPVR